MRFSFDHLVIGAESLAAGDAWAAETFSARLGPGGSHDIMGTHNRLARLPVGYLEIIAVDPEAPPPARPRWYGLDAADWRAAIIARPRPIAWVLGVDDLDAAVQRADWAAGSIIAVGRDDLRWRMALPDDGRPVEDVLPAFIEWPAAQGHAPPVDRMIPSPRALRRLTLHHRDPETLRRRLRSVDAEAAMRAAGVELSVRARALDAADAPWPLEAMFTTPTLNVSA